MTFPHFKFSKFFPSVFEIVATVSHSSYSFFQVDVIVNTTNNKVDLSANACGKALLRVAGQELANECKKIGNLQTGEMASTGPGKLNCKHVYHVRSSSWDNGDGTLVILV